MTEISKKWVPDSEPWLLNNWRGNVRLPQNPQHNCDIQPLELETQSYFCDEELARSKVGLLNTFCYIQVNANLCVNQFGKTGKSDVVTGGGGEIHKLYLDP